MNTIDERPDDLEAELAALRPVAPPVDVRRRIAAVLDAPPRLTDAEPTAPPAIVTGWRYRLVPLAAAACLALLLTLVPIAGPQPTVQRKPPPQFTLDLDAIIDTTGPTVWAYRHALSDSPDALDALLDRHGRTLLPPTEPVSIGSLH